jgi:hypothetical protein
VLIHLHSLLLLKAPTAAVHGMAALLQDLAYDDRMQCQASVYPPSNANYSIYIEA